MWELYNAIDLCYILSLFNMVYALRFLKLCNVKMSPHVQVRIFKLTLNITLNSYRLQWR